MTIYCLKLSTGALEGFTSIQHVVGLCQHLCRHFLLHFTDLTRSNPQVQTEVNAQITNLGWYLDTLQQLIPDQSETGFVMDVRSIHVDKRKTWNRPAYQKQFTLETLDQVSSEILLQIMTKLLEDSLACIKPHVLLSTSDFHRLECYHALETIPSNIGKACGIELDEACSFNYVRIQVQVEDGRQVVKFLA